MNNKQEEEGTIFNYSKENSVHQIYYHKFAISRKEIAFRLPFSFTSFKMKFNLFTTRHTTVSKQVSAANNILEKTSRKNCIVLYFVSFCRICMPQN